MDLRGIFLGLQGKMIGTLEAHRAVLEVKQVVDSEELLYAGNKAGSVRRLRRTSVPIPHAGQPETALVFFLVKLLSRLQAMGTVPAVDFEKYGRVL